MFEPIRNEFSDKSDEEISGMYLKTQKDFVSNKLKLKKLGQEVKDRMLTVVLAGEIVIDPTVIHVKTTPWCNDYCITCLSLTTITLALMISMSFGK